MKHPASMFMTDGNFADLVVFDWHQIQDNTSPEKCDAAPTGISHVFYQWYSLHFGFEVNKPKTQW